MKKLLSLTIVLFIVTSCINTNKKKAEKLIEEHLKVTMNDFSSYEPMEFGSLDSTYSDFFSTEECKKLINERDRISDEQKQYKEYIDVLDSKKMDEMYQKLLDESEVEYYKVTDKIFSGDSFYRQIFIGWNMSHQFRGANAFGGKIIGMMTFYFDKDITTVINVVDINEKLRISD